MEETLAGCNVPQMLQLICDSREARRRKDAQKARTMHANACSYGLELHHEVGNRVVPMLIECGEFVLGQQLFLRLDRRKEHSWTSMLQGYVEHGKPGDAIRLFRCMQAEEDESAAPSAYTFQSLIKACAREMSVDEGRSIHARIVEEGFESDPFVATTLVDMYAKVGLVDESRDVFDEFGAGNVVTWNALLTGYAQSGLFEKVLEIVQKMQLEGACAPNAITFVCALRNGGPLSYGQELHAIAAREGFEADELAGNALMGFYLAHGLFTEAWELFDELPARDVVAWTTLIAGYADHGLEDEALLCLHEMRAEGGGVSPNEVSFSCVLKACADVERGREIHRQIVSQAFDGDPHVADSLVAMYARCGEVIEARALLDELRIESCVAGWAALAEGYANRGSTEGAIGCLERIILSGSAELDAATAVCCLKVCGIVGSARLTLMFHAEIAKEGLEAEELRVGSAVVDRYARHGLLAEAEDAFRELPIRDAASWTSLMQGYAEHESGEEALAVWDEMLEEGGGVAGDAMAYACLLRACGSAVAAAEGREAHCEICKKGFEADPRVCVELVGMYARCGFLGEARDVPVLDCPSGTGGGAMEEAAAAWTALMTGYVEHGLAREAFSCYERMRAMGVSPNAGAFVCLSKACGDARAAELGREVHADIARVGLDDADPAVGNALVSMYMRCGIVGEALHVFGKLAEQTAVSWTAVLAGYTELGLDAEALAWLERMKLCGAPGDRVALLCGLRACANANAFDPGLALHAQAAKEGFESHPTVREAAVEMYAKWGWFAEALDAFGRIATEARRDARAALIAGYVEHGAHEEALECFDEMMMREEEGSVPTIACLLCAVKACGAVGALQKLFEIHTRIVERGLDDDDDARGRRAVAIRLVECYAKCGALAEGSQAFETCCDRRDSAPWNALIRAYACQGDSRAVFSLLQRMEGDDEEESARADGIALLGVISACSHDGRVGQGLQAFCYMVLGLVVVDPSIDHYTGAIDLLGRAGRLHEALAVAQATTTTTPCEPPDAAVLNTIAAACLNWGDYDGSFLDWVSTNAKLCLPEAAAGNCQ